MQQGTFVADLCFLAPENSPQRWASPVKAGHDRPGYDFDGCPPEVVLTRMKVKDGRLTLPDGMSYRMLVLPQVETMTPKLLRRIRELVQDGATIVGSPPVKSPSLENYPECDEEVKALAKEVWGGSEAPVAVTERRFGKGRVIWGGPFGLPRERVADESEALAGAKWIWRGGEGNPAHAAPPGRRYFLREFTVANLDDVTNAWLTLTADNEFECWLNGLRVSHGDNWKHAYSANATRLLKPGTNFLAVTAVNTTDHPNPAGLIAALTLKSGGGMTQTLVSDSKWLAAQKAGENWQTTAPADDWMPAMEIGALGIAPWDDLGSSPDATDTTLDIAQLCNLLRSEGVPPDFSAEGQPDAGSLRYIHKRIAGTDYYFVANKQPRLEQAVCTFRVTGRRPEFWRPDTGRIERPAVYDERDGLTRVPISFEPSGSVFVMFRDAERAEPDRIVAVTPDAGGKLKLTRTGTGFEAEARAAGTYTLKLANGETREIKIAAPAAPFELTGPWQVSFDPKWGGLADRDFQHARRLVETTRRRHQVLLRHRGLSKAI